jgi:hypothetical protein
MNEARYRLALLGDTAADLNATGGKLVADYTIGGVTYTNNKKHFNSIDGVWKQAQTGVAAGKTPKTIIAENYLLTKATQLAITDAHCYDAIKSVYDKASHDLKGNPNAYILATSGVYNGYKNYLMTNTMSGGGLSEMLINGVKNPAYAGIPIFEDQKSQNTIVKYTNIAAITTTTEATASTGTTQVKVVTTKGMLETGKLNVGTSTFVYTSKDATNVYGDAQNLGVQASGVAVTNFGAQYDCPHRVIMATAENLGCYTLDEADLNNLEVFYDKITRTSYFAYGFLIDVVVGREELLSVAY